MSNQYFGFFEYRKERYDFDFAIAKWDGDRLDAYASSSDIIVYFCGIPFCRVEHIGQLKGKVYRGDGGETVYSEGVVRFFEKNYAVKGEPFIECISANLEQGLVALEFEFEIALSNAKSRKVRGGMRCGLGEIPPIPPIGIDD